MNQSNESAVISLLPMSQFHVDLRRNRIRISDERIAQLLIVLHEIDVGIETVTIFSEHELRQIVASAILACGFKDFDDVRNAMGPVLDAMERRPSAMEDS